MGCPRKLKSCEQKFIKHYPDNCYFCFGVLTRKGKGEVKMDCIRQCAKTFYHKKPVVTESTPDEVIILAAGYSYVAHEWLMAFEPFDEWWRENDK